MNKKSVLIEPAKNNNTHRDNLILFLKNTIAVDFRQFIKYLFKE